MTYTQQQIELNKILKDNGFEFIDAFEIEELHSEGADITENIQERINEQEIIYYGKAMEYLLEEDASLSEVMELASDLGYETKNLNSELLATILYQQRLNEKLGDLVSALESFEFKEEETEE